MADNPVSELGGKTPLESANTPTMDAMASAGVLGSVLTIPDGMPAGSDVAILSIFGCDPRFCYTGRAPLEAAATGINLVAGNVAYRCNMVTFDDSGESFDDKRLLSHSAGSIEGELSATLIRELFEIPEFAQAAHKAGITVYPALSFRHIAVQNAADVSDLVLIPPHDNLGKKAGELMPRGGSNAAVLEGLMRLARDLLENHPINNKRRQDGEMPANGIWFWAEGTVAQLPSFVEKYGKTGAVVSAVPLCQGIGVLTGLDKISVDGATGVLHTNYEGKVAAAVEALRSRDFAAIHIEAPDECSHDGDMEGKLQAIEWIDSRILAPLIKELSEAKFSDEKTDYRILLISDHKTLLSTRGHDGTPVPYGIYDSRIDNQTGLTFNETNGSLGNFISDGLELMSVLFEDSL